MSNAVADLLRRARARIATPETWCKGSFARNASGRKCKASSAHAVAFCAEAAIWADCADDQRGDVKRRAFDLIEDAMGNSDIRAFNDAPATTHFDVLAAYDRAVAAAEAVTPDAAREPATAGVGR